MIFVLLISANRFINTLTWHLLITNQSLIVISFLSLGSFILLCLFSFLQKKKPKFSSMQQVQELRKVTTNVNFSSDYDTLKRFLLFFQEGEQYKYLHLLRNVTDTIQIDLNDLALFDETGIVKRIEENAFTYLQIVQKAIDDILFNDEELSIEPSDDIFLFQRLSRLKELNPEKKITDVFPGSLLRNFTVNFMPRNIQIKGVREIQASDIGSLIKTRGIVTRVSQVKPCVKVVTYICESCGTEIYQTVENETFDMLEECFSEKCRTRKIKGTLCLVTRGSRFVKYQSIQLQELSSDVPRGSIPRIINVECFSSLTEKVKPGEFVVLGGIFMPRPYHGFRKLKAGLLNDIYIHCTHIESNAAIPLPSNAVVKTSIDNLVSSFAPEIYGMRDVKKILLLMLVGAPRIMREDGMKIRGDINVLLVGDPGIAKSQLLKTVVRVSKRGVFTTGKGSSGVGLTASVMKDPVTGEVVLEGGALVLADKGVCCIDELDKMNENDRVAIHEVMEQQSVSISKAGINTTLNARCAILAAANPMKGRYDTKRTLEQNIGLPISLLSRFDVLVILKDSQDKDTDINLASHIVSLHFENPEAPLEYSYLRNYIESAKLLNPTLPRSLKNILLEAYCNARKDPNITPRYLLSLIRMTLAHARLRMALEANEEDAHSAINLLELMKVPSPANRAPVSTKREIYTFILSLAKEQSNGEKTVDLFEVYETAPFDKLHIDKTVEDFIRDGIWIKSNKNTLVIIN